MSTATRIVSTLWYTAWERHRTCTEVTHDVGQRLLQREEKRAERVFEGGGGDIDMVRWRLFHFLHLTMHKSKRSRWDVFVIAVFAQFAGIGNQMILKVSLPFQIYVHQTLRYHLVDLR